MQFGAAAGAISLLASAPTRAHAQDISVTVNGEPVQFKDIGPQQINGRTMVPVRGVLEKLGATISYNNQTQTVTASTPTIDIQLKIGARTAIVNANNVVLDVPAQSIRDHTFVPLRFLGEALGASLKWDAATRTVVIVTKDAIPSDVRTPDERANARPPRVSERNGPAPVIDSFSHNAKRWLRAGETVRATLQGSPGGDASFRIPGLVEDVPMRETEPGRYVGEWRVPDDRPLQLKSAAVIGSLKVGARTAPLLQAGEVISVDAIPPHARDFAPEDKANVSDTRPNISAVFEDRGSGIDKESVRLLVNGHDVTDQATITRDFISYKPAMPLPAGEQQVEVKLADAAGNRADAHWTFMEQPRAAGGIKSVTDNGDRVLQPGDTLHVEMTGSPGGRAMFSTGTIQNIPLREDQPGHYAADYTIRKGDDIESKPLAVRLVTPDGEKFEQASKNAVRVTTGKPTAPVVTSPGLNAAPTNPLIIRGKATPNSKVQVRVDYRNRVLGIVALQGTAADTVVTADKNGNWQTEPINIGGILGSRGVEYTISATAVNAANEKSDTITSKSRIQ